MTRIEAITNFLKTTNSPHLAKLYTPEMEVQVNVAPDGGTRVNDIYKGRHWVGWKGQDGTFWKSFRIPLNADSMPQYTDRDIKFNLTDHVDGIGMTGWNWVQRESLWVGFDFDSIANHKAGLTQDALDNLLNILLNLDYTTIVKSTSGKGYHVYIHFSRPVKTENHTYHAALAKSILNYLIMDTGHNFKADVDVCGGVLWVYHRKQEGTDGLSLIKEGTTFDVTKIPSNWLDYVEVTSKKQKKTTLRQDMSELAASQNQVVLDPEHNALLKWFTEKAQRDYWWDNDHNMLVCHTLDLAQAHADLHLRGIFYTASSGSTTQNCFCFPMQSGSWVVRRHGKNVKEHTYWTIDANGWTRCMYNISAEVEPAARTNKGIRNAKNEYIFASHKDCLIALKQMDLTIQYSLEWLTIAGGPDRESKIKVKGDVLILSIKQLYPTEIQPDGFLLNKEYWEIIIDLPKNKKELSTPDNLIRHTISNGSEAGWFIKTQNSWISQSRANVYTVLIAQEDYERCDIEGLVGKCILTPWKLVNYPFLDEYPGGREWNKDAASFKIAPVSGSCSTWLSILQHCGKNLTDSVKNHSWCMENGINDGGEYLLCWLASMIQAPEQPLPYLCFFGEQNTGKSTLHEAINAFLLKKGYARADHALTNPSGFNSEIANAVLCVVEETDLRINKEAANRIKDWVTGKTISIRMMYRNTYDICNTTHWMQCTNDLNYCMVLPGDTRIVVVKVDRPNEEIPKQRLFDALEKEASAFLHLLQNIELPKSPTRLAIPVISTFEKSEVENSNRNLLELFVKERCYQRKGAYIDFEEFYVSFLDWIPPNERGTWSKNKISRSLPKTGLLCKGKHGADNKTILGNISLDPDVNEEAFYYRVNTFNGRMEKVENERSSTADS